MVTVPPLEAQHSHGCALPTRGGTCDCGLEGRYQRQAAAFRDLADRGRAFTRGLDYEVWLQVRDAVGEVDE